MNWLGQDAPLFVYMNVYLRNKNPDGSVGDRIIYPGFKDNSRLMKWVKDLKEGKIPPSEYKVTPIGIIPIENASLFDGLNLSLEDRRLLTEFNEDQWRTEIKRWIRHSVYDLEMDVPDEIRHEFEKLAAALNVELPAEWKNALPWEEIQRRKKIISQVNREFKFDQYKGLNTVQVRDIFLDFLAKRRTEITLNKAVEQIIVAANNPELTYDQVDGILLRGRELMDAAMTTLKVAGANRLSIPR